MSFDALADSFSCTIAVDPCSSPVLYWYTVHHSTNILLYYPSYCRPSLPIIYYSLNLSCTRSPVLAIVVALPLPTAGRNRYRIDVIPYPTPSLTSIPSVGAAAIVIRSTCPATEVTICRNIREPSPSGSTHTTAQAWTKAVSLVRKITALQ